MQEGRERGIGGEQKIARGGAVGNVSSILTSVTQLLPTTKCLAAL